jgi:hypothetical protein
VLEGVLDLTPAEHVQNSGFVAIVMKERFGPFNLEDYNAILIKAKTDGRIYVTNVKVKQEKVL